jgi:acetyl esterase/lipase
VSLRSIFTIAIAMSIALFASKTATAQAKVNKSLEPTQPTHHLWPNGAPMAKGDAEEDKPLITIQLPKTDAASKPAPAIVVCPGGGYAHLAWDYEGEEVAAWLNTQGIAGFVLRYRLGPKYNHPAQLMDAQRAIRTIRSRAAEWNIDPARIGILGFSAGGHLTSTAGTHFDSGKPDDPDPIERVSCRPDFIVPVYAVISMSDPFTHKGSRKNLLGENPEPSLVALLSNEKQVTTETPPVFLVLSTEDTAVAAENSINFYLACKEKQVPVEMHVYEQGKHGFGMGKGDPALSTWPGLMVEWLKKRGILAPGL